MKILNTFSLSDEQYQLHGRNVKHWTKCLYLYGLVCDLRSATSLSEEWSYIKQLQRYRLVG